MADRWLIEHGPSKDQMTMVGKAGTRADAAATAQKHFDSNRGDSGTERLVFPPDNPAGEYPYSGGVYRITRLGTGQWRAIP